MNRAQQIRAGICALAVIISAIVLIPTFQSWSFSAAERAAAERDPALAERMARVDAKAIRRGLDLQGGMYLVMEVDQEGMTNDQALDALKRVEEIVRNRVDQFGISEPIIQTQGTNRLIVQLPGLQDPERAKDLIGRTARLEFRLVRPPEEMQGVLSRLDEAFKAAAGVSAAPAGEAEAGAPDGAVGTPGAAAADSQRVADPFAPLPPLAGAGSPEDEAFYKDHPFSAYVNEDNEFLNEQGWAYYVAEEDFARVKKLLESPAARAVPVNLSLQFGDEWATTRSGKKGRLLFLVNAQAGLTGDRLQSARAEPDHESTVYWQVSFSLDRRGTSMFGKLTRENVGRQLAISLDGQISSAPVIQTAITQGQGRITGRFTSQEASDLALLLRAGALPATVTIEEERTVGPGLGRDSIRQGVTAALIGALLVVLFAVFYYRLTGLVATAALAANVLILLAILAQFGLVLTLPGLAGIVLTVGMAIDANVLINERVREELRKSKTVRAAVDAGFHNASRTIIDANLTTLLAGIILLWFGTGPIKGFAVTMSIGIVTSVFTALVMTRFFLELMARNPQRTKLSI